MSLYSIESWVVIFRCIIIQYAQTWSGWEYSLQSDDTKVHALSGIGYM